MKNEEIHSLSPFPNRQQEDQFTSTYYLYVGKVYRHCLSSSDQFEMTKDAIQAIFGHLLSQPGRLAA